MAENFLIPINDDALTAQQYADSFRRSEHLEPEKALLVAILDDAIHQYRKYKNARDTAGKERFRETEEWIKSEDNDWIFSFNNICELLGLNPDYVRHTLLDSPEQIEKAKKPEVAQSA